METQCAPEQEFRHRDKLPWRDAALKRRSSTTNKGPLLSSQLFASGFEHLSRLTHPVNKQRILEKLDRAQFEKLRDQYPYRPGSPRINRFEDVVYWIKINIERAQDLWLDRSPPMHILDLGCGAGYFLYIAKYFGHNVVGFDIDNEPLFRATTQLLEVPRV